MKHSNLERAIVKYIKQNNIFKCHDLFISSDENDNNHEILAEVSGITKSCRPDVVAYNFYGKKFYILGEAKSSNDFNNTDEKSKARHNRQMDVMINALRVKRNIEKYLIYACEIDMRIKVEQMLLEKTAKFDAKHLNIILIDQVHNPELF